MNHVVIVRDRGSAGGGIHNYYQALRPYFTIAYQFVDVGRAHRFYETSEAGGKSRQSTAVRLIADCWALVRHLFRLPDLVHVNPGLDATTRRALRRDAVNIWLAKLFRRPVLVFWRGWDEEACGAAEFPGGNSGFLSRTYRLADAHIVLATDFKQDLQRWGFSAPVYIETTVASDEVMQHSPEKRTLDPDRVNLLFLSRVEIDKGVLELLDAFCLLQRKRPGVYTLTFAGDGPFLQALRERVEASGTAGVTFPGYVAGEAKIQCYLQASIFCFLSSHGEGMPNAVLEAMAMGLPVISSDVGGLKDILRNGETGLVAGRDREAPPGARFNVNEVVDLIEKLAGDPAFYERISDHNKRLALERFAAKKVAGRLESIYRDILNPFERAGAPGENRMTRRK